MKQYRWGLLGAALLLLLFSTVQAHELAWRLDAMPDSDEIRSFRTSWGTFREVENPPTREGLDELRISGSGQFGAAGVPVLISRIRALTDAPIYVIDLRQEDHGFVDGTAVSLHGARNQANAGMTAPEVEADEAEQLSSLIDTDFQAVPMGYADTAVMEPFETTVQSVQTERALIEDAGLQYVRIAATDQVWPEPQAIDAFIDFYRTLPDTPVWLHFHCHAGHGRTTTFMALYDMLRNPSLEVESVAWRQYLLGGSNLLSRPDDADTSWQAEAGRERIAMLYLLHAYIQEQQPAGFAVSWSEWLAGHEE